MSTAAAAAVTSDVVIVGAGLSGLASALHLLYLGVSKAASITIVEGRNRVGGRLLAHEGVDVGGAWCWTSSHHDMLVLANRLGIEAFEQHDNGLNVVDYGDNTTRTKERFDSAKVRFAGGAAAITSALASHLREQGINIHLDCKINRISTEHNDEVFVEGLMAGSPVTWNAKAVFLAVPPRLLLPPLMTWEPSLPPTVARIAEATPTWMANTTKVLVTYSRAFWRELGLSGNAMSYGGGPITQLYDSCGPDSSDEGPYALCGFIFGNEASDSPPDDATLRAQVLTQLERLFGSDAKSAISFSSHRWGDQPLTSGGGGGAGGGYDSMGHRELRKAFGSRGTGSPPRVWLSAAETDAQHAGLMEGALRAGRRVVGDAVRHGVLEKRGTADEKSACTADNEASSEFTS